MKRLSQVLCGVAAILMAGSAISVVHAQSATGRALLAYKEGVTPEQENKDRRACNEWAIEQSGFDPSAIYQAQMAGVRPKTIFEVAGALGAADGGTDPRWGGGAFSGASTSADKRRLAELYNSYLRAGALCLEGRGYTVAR